MERIDWNALIGPAVVAAVIAGIISVITSVITLLVNRKTTLTTHSQRLAFDREQAERRISAEIALAEKKVDLERAFAAWTRQSEFAEEVIADFYEARDIITAARMPGSFDDEGSTRQKEGWETEEDTRRLNSYYVPAERLFKKSEFFSNLYARRNRFLAVFGQQAAKPYDEIYKVRGEVLIAIRMLISTYQGRRDGTLPGTRKQWEAEMGWSIPQRIPLLTA